MLFPTTWLGIKDVAASVFGPGGGCACPTLWGKGNRAVFYIAALNARLAKTILAGFLFRDFGMTETFKASKLFSKIRTLFIRMLLVAVGLFLLILAFGAFATDGWLGGPFLIFAATLLLPAARKKLPARWRNARYIAFGILCLMLLGNSLADLSRKISAERKTNNHISAAISEFEKQPQKVKNEITALIESKRFAAALEKSRPLLNTSDEDIQKLYNIAAAEQQKIQQEKIDSEVYTKALNRWVINRASSAMDDSPTIKIQIDAVAPVNAWPRPTTPSLRIQCVENKTNVLFIIDSAFTPILGEYGKAGIRVRIDAENAYSQLWSKSTDGEAAFAPNAIGFLKKLRNAKKLLIEFTPLNAGPATAEFDLTGIHTLAEEVAQTCKWSF